MENTQQIIQQQEESFDYKALFFKLYRYWYFFVLTVFIALYIKGVVDTKEEGVDIILLNAPVIIVSAKWSFIAVLRNFYKVLTE